MFSSIRGILSSATSDYEWDLPVEVTGRKVRNRRRARAGSIGTADVSAGDARRAPYRLRTRTK